MTKTNKAINFIVEIIRSALASIITVIFIIVLWPWIDSQIGSLGAGVLMVFTGEFWTVVLALLAITFVAKILASMAVPKISTGDD